MELSGSQYILALPSKRIPTIIYNIEHHGVNPKTGLRINPKFQNGDLISVNGKKAVFITYAFWEPDPTVALIQFLDIPAISTRKHKRYNKKLNKIVDVYISNFNYDYTNEENIVLLKNK